MVWWLVEAGFALTSDVGGVLASIASALYLSANGTGAWFSAESFSLRGATLIGAVWVAAWTLWGLCVGSHHAVRVLLSEDSVRHSGAVRLLFPATVLSDGRIKYDPVARLFAMVAYMLFYPVVSLVASVLSAVLLVMFMSNGVYHAVMFIYNRLGRLEAEPLPLPSVPILGTVFALLNQMFRSVLRKRTRIITVAAGEQ